MSTNNYANKEQLIDLLQAQQVPVLGAGGGFAPLGTLAFYDGTVAPQGWLACDGTVYNISDYPELAAHYASHHGASNFYGGNGTTTFAVPDLRGEFLRGTGTNSHTNQGSGANVGVHQDGTEHRDIIGSSDGHIYTVKVGSNVVHSTNSDSNITGGEFTSSGTGSTGVYADYGYFTSRPTNTSFLICVKATVSGDPNAHQYSTEEQVVGKWIDGSDIYERTAILSITAPQNEWFNILDLTSAHADKLIDVKARGCQNGIVYGSVTDLFMIQVGMNNGIIQGFKSSGYTTTIDSITVQYTKTQS